MPDDKSMKVAGTVVALLLAGAMGLAGWSLARTEKLLMANVGTQAALKSIDEKLETLASDDDMDKRLYEQAKLDTWAKDQINRVRYEIRALHADCDLPPVTWPD